MRQDEIKLLSYDQLQNTIHETLGVVSTSSSQKNCHSSSNAPSFGAWSSRVRTAGIGSRQRGNRMNHTLVLSGREMKMKTQTKNQQTQISDRQQYLRQSRQTGTNPNDYAIVY